MSIETSAQQAEPSPTSTPQRRIGRAWRLHLLVLAAYLLLTLIMTWPLVREFTTAIPGDGFDGWQNFWNQWWIKVALIDQQSNPLVTDLLYHPTGVSLYFHTLNPFNGLTTLPIQLAFGLIPAYNSAILLAWVLGGYGVFLLVRRQLTSTNCQLTIANSSAFLAGAIFTLSPFHMAHLLGHMQVLSLQWIPFYVLYLLRSLDAVNQRRPWLHEAFMAGLFLILVGLCDWYYVLYLALFTGLAVLWAWLGAPAVDRPPQPAESRLAGEAGRLGRLLLPPLLAGGIFFVALSFWLVPMIRETRQFSFMVRPATDLYILSASVMDFLVPNRLHTLFRPESFAWIGNQISPVSERTISIGYIALALAVVGALIWRRRAGLWIAGALFFFAMALGPVIHFGNITAADIPEATELPLHFTPFGILAYFSDFVRLSRSVSRYAVMVQLCVAVLAGMGLAALLTRLQAAQTPQTQGRRTVLAVALLCLGLVLAEYWVAPYPMSAPDTPDWYATLAETPESGAVLNLPMNYDRPGYLLHQTVHQRPLTVAYISRDDPRTLTERAPVLQHFRHLGPDILAADPAALGTSVLADLDVEYVVLDRYKMPGGLEREYTTALATEIFAGQAPVFEDDRITVYRVATACNAAQLPAIGCAQLGPVDRGSGRPTSARGARPGRAKLRACAGRRAATPAVPHRG